MASDSVPALSRLRLAAWWLLVLFCGDVRADDEAFWASHVAPLLKDRCAECHNPLKTKGRLDLSSLQTILRGGERGSAVLPGRVEDSLLFQVLSAGADPHMPPKGQLSEDQIGVIRTWISRLTPIPASAAAGKGLPEPGPTVPEVSKPVWTPPASMGVPEALDRFIELGWKDRGVTPAAPASDRTLVRRLYLDLVGRVPTVEEASQFLADPRKDRWSWLVDELISSPEFSRHMAGVFDVVLMGRRGAEAEERRRTHRWFEYLETAFRTNRPWNRVVAELIRARPGPSERGAEWYLYERKNNPQAMAEAVAPVVFGVQIKCAQCHDHMVAREIKQAHYWGLVAAFNRTRTVDTPSGPGLAESAIGGFVSFANLRKESQPAFMTFLNGRRVDEPWPKEGEREVDSPENYVVPPPVGKDPVQEPARPKFSRREALAEAVTEGNPLLARATVNRFWALLLGRGLVHPVDLMDSKHPASHPDLLAWLSVDFDRSGYDVQRLIRNLVLSKTYCLDSRPAPGARTPPESFAFGIEKSLSAEQWAASLTTVLTGKPPGPGASGSKDALRQALIRQFPDLFAAEYQPSLQQALFLSNSPILDAQLAPAPGNLTGRLVEISDPGARVSEAILAVYGRPPTPDETREAVAYLSKRPVAAGTRELVWALVTGAEFQLNH